MCPKIPNLGSEPMVSQYLPGRLFRHPSRRLSRSKQKNQQIEQFPKTQYIVSFPRL
jgi:hypothetical protein